MTTTNTIKTVVTYQAPNGQTINLCARHEKEGDESEHGWYCNARGEEYCSVSHGQHAGSCDECDREGGHGDMKTEKPQPNPKTFGEMANVPLRLSAKVQERAETLTGQLSAGPWGEARPLTRADVLRLAISRGLDALEEEYADWKRLVERSQEGEDSQ